MNKRQAAKPKPWHRKLWAVEMKSKSCKPKGMIIAEAWHSIIPSDYEGEPPRCLLFTTEKQAIDWCKLALERYSKDDPDWRFRPVRVTEKITLVRK